MRRLRHDDRGSPAGLPGSHVGAGAWFRLRALDYDRQVTPLGDGQFYWHLLFRGERINGGLSSSYTGAMSDAWFVMSRHIYSNMRASARESACEFTDGLDPR